MGTLNSTCGCEHVEAEEETLSRIMNSSKIAQMETSLVYQEFLKCLKDDGQIDKEKYSKLIELISAESSYKNFFLNYLNKFTKNNLPSPKRTGAAKVGIILIYLSKGGNKIEHLIKHFKKFYYESENSITSEMNKFDENIHDYIQDIIDLNTTDIIDGISFCLTYESESELWGIWTDKRKQIFLLSILKILFEVKKKHEDTHEDIKSVVEKIQKDFLELTFCQLKGEYIRNFLYEEYLKEVTYD